MPLFGPNVKRLQARGRVDALIQVLREHKVERLRRDAVLALGELYPRLDATQAQRKRIIARHLDPSQYAGIDDAGCGWDLDRDAPATRLAGPHVDQAIGVEFPL